jgi:hypothetical protein
MERDCEFYPPGRWRCHPPVTPPRPAGSLDVKAAPAVERPDTTHHAPMLATVATLITPRGSTAAALLLALSACGGGEPGATTAPELDPATRQASAAVGDLTQTVTLSATSLHPGDVLELRSTVVNGGARPVVATTRTCGFDVEAPPGVRGPDFWARCGAYSMSGPLAPGESRTEQEHVVIGDRPDLHTLRVRHLVEPELWVEVKVRILLSDE